MKAYIGISFDSLDNQNLQLCK